MKSKLRAISLVLVLLLIGFAGGIEELMSEARGTEPFTWENPGDNPFAGTREEAMARRGEAFPRLGFTEEQTEAFILQTDKPGTQVQIHSGDRLGGMVSGGGRVDFDFPVNFVRAKPELPVSAEAEMWLVEWEGQVYTLYLPAICRNWAFKVEPAQCLVVQVPSVPGVEMKSFVATPDGKRLPASGCSELCDGDDCGEPPRPCDTCDLSEVTKYIPESHLISRTGAHVPQHTLQTFKFGLEAKNAYIEFCVDGSLPWIVEPEDWGSKSTLVIPYNGRTWPTE